MKREASRDERSIRIPEPFVMREAIIDEGGNRFAYRSRS